MFKIGYPPFLECSRAGDRRFSAFCAHIRSRGGRTIEEIYQGSKIINGRSGLTILEAKGKLAENREEVSRLYHELWVEYFEENPDLYDVIREYNGFTDRYGSSGSVCQAESVFRIRNQYIMKHPRSILEMIECIGYLAQEKVGHLVVKASSLQCDVVIDRTTVFGNPYPLIGDSVEERVYILSEFYKEFRARLRTDVKYLESIKALKGKRLGCHCSNGDTTPDPRKFCHGHIIAYFVNVIGIERLSGE